jgi:putative PEP-CTERM system integral membrane protein
MQKVLNFTFSFIFYGWNLIFFFLVYFLILPLSGWIFIATIQGLIPMEFFITGLGIVGIPTACTIIGNKYFGKQPWQLINLFYGVEMPLFILFLLRLFIFRELTAASNLVIYTLLVCVAAFFIELMSGYQQQKKYFAWMQLGSHTLVLLMGLYTSALILFYAIPWGFAFFRELLRFQWLTGFIDSLIHYPSDAILGLLLGGLFLALSVSIFVFMPVGLAGLYVNSGQNIIRSFAAQHGKSKAIFGSLAVVTTWVVLFIGLNQQPQIQAFQLLDKPALTDSDRQTVLKESEKIRQGLLNSYLYNYRYLSDVESSNDIEMMYADIFGLPESVTRNIQYVFNQLMSPFLYQGNSGEQKKAAELYEKFFDVPLQKGEQKEVLHALQSTFNQEEVKAGLLNIGVKNVWLKRQEVNIAEHDSFADVELYEVYQNKTNEVQEILYYFSLPESATITGIWLGDTADRAKRFPYQVSPRGAAQKVYNSQVRRERPIDPALLEQVGPQQYRLRAFPVPVGLRWGEKADQVNRPLEMHLWLTYQVVKQEKGWQLPQLNEKRNIFWTNFTERRYNGKKVRSYYEWLPDFLPVTNSLASKQLTSQQVNLDGGLQITAKPLGKEDYSLPTNQKFAVIVDTSYSMGKHARSLRDNLQWLKNNGYADQNSSQQVLSNNDADLYLVGTNDKAPVRIDDFSNFQEHDLTYYGTVQPGEILQQFVKMQGETKYDGILLLTDAGSYELSQDKKDLPEINSPLWFIHLDQAISPAYDDATIQVLQKSAGGVGTDISEVLQRITTTQKLTANLVNQTNQTNQTKPVSNLSTEKTTKPAKQDQLKPTVVSVVDGYAWYLQPNISNIINNSQPQTFAPLAARQLVLGMSQQMSQETLQWLDNIHAIAKKYHIVTPYSSMIVLVNEEQRQMLAEAEASTDRFNRTAETGKEALSKPFNPLNSPTQTVAIPEPSHILGTGAIAILLLMTRQRRRLKREDN